MNQISNKKSLCHKLTALFLSICLSAAFAPSVLAAAESPSDITAAASAESTAQATQATQAVQAVQSSYTQTAGAGFENVESDGGTMLVGTARVPKADGSFATVKFIYSSGINLNEKSLKLINTELNACGVTVSGSMVYVSRSDLVSDSTLVAETSERQAVFACGSEAAPTVLKAYPAYESVEESFEYLYRGYVYSISEYTSLSGVFAGRSEITLSDDGKSAYTSIVMAEDYVEKVINGKTVKILMINSELKYCFRAPKLVYVKDDSYNVASNSDIVYHYGSTTANTSETTIEASQTTTTVPSEEMLVSSDDESAASQASTTASQTSQASTDTQSTTDTTTVNIWDYLTTAAETKITAGASPIVTSVTEATTTATTASTAAPTSTETQATSTAPTTTAATTTAVTTTVTSATANNEDSAATASPTLPAPSLTTQTNENSAILPNVTAADNGNSQRGIVNTRRLPLNVRSGPGKKYMVVTVLPKGTYVTVIDTSNPDWYLVKTMNKVVGYAYSGYIRIM